VSRRPGGGRGTPDDLTAGHQTQVWLATYHATTPSTGGYWYHQQTQTPHPAAQDEKIARTTPWRSLSGDV